MTVLMPRARALGLRSMTPKPDGVDGNTVSLKMRYQAMLAAEECTDGGNNCLCLGQMMTCLYGEV